MKKIAFLYIDEPYMIYHSVGVAIELAKKTKYQIDLLCVQNNMTLIQEIVSTFKADNIKIHVLRPYWYFTLPNYISSKIQLKKILFFKYRNLLKSYDAFVSCKFDDLFLKKVLNKEVYTQYFFTNHGISNRKISFLDYVLDYDLFFILGSKEREIRDELGHHNYAEVGFLKPDALIHEIPKEFFKNKHLTFVYNPHWEKGLTSFNTFAEILLSFFSKEKKYNLIFAPHGILKERNTSYQRIVSKFNDVENILIDSGSEYSNTMTYTKYADVYIGDVSSQALEFVYFKERPCLFLDAYNINSNASERPLSWDLGEVISDPKNLEIALERSLSIFESKYKAIQQVFKEEMFYEDPQYSPSQLAAQAIINKLQ